MGITGITVDDFKYIRGVNDAEYIELLKNAYERQKRITSKAIAKLKKQTEIIRCKDCKYNVSSHKCLHPESFFLVPPDDFYCGFAERRTNNKNG